MMFRVVVALGAVLMLAGCASGGTGLVSDPALTRRTSTNVIAADEIARQAFKTAGQAVVALRPNWEHVNVYLDNKPFGRFEKLEEILSDSVKEIRMLSRQEARVRFGTDAQQCILVTRK